MRLLNAIFLPALLLATSAAVAATPYGKPLPEGVLDQVFIHVEVSHFTA